MIKKALKAFTLIELMVVVAIIAVLGMVIIPSTVYQIRSARVTEDNDHAHEIFNAAQNYLIQLQRKGENPRTYFAKTAETDRYALWTYDHIGLVGVPEYSCGTVPALDSDPNNRNGFDTTGGFSWSYGHQIGGAGADSDDERPRACALGLRKQLAGSMGNAQGDTNNWWDEGSWGVVIDMDTYTCLAAYYNERGGGSPHGNAQWWGIALLANEPFHSVDEQIQAIGSGGSSFDVRKNCGQYPIPMY